MESDNKTCVRKEKDSVCHPLIRKSSFSNTMSLDDTSTTAHYQMNVGIPKFLRTQSSSVILPSPSRKSRSVTRFLGNFTQTNVGDSFTTKNSIREKNRNYSSLNNLSRLMSPSSRKLSRLNQSKSLRSVDHIIDENTEFRISNNDFNVEHNDSNISEPNLLELSSSCVRSTSRLAHYRAHQFRRRSISWDCAENIKNHKRYGLDETFNDPTFMSLNL